MLSVKEATDLLRSRGGIEYQTAKYPLQPGGGVSGPRLWVHGVVNALKAVWNNKNDPKHDGQQTSTGLPAACAGGGLAVI
jgi:hypothetical protein